MATLRAIAATGETIVNTELTVTSALAGDVDTFLPAIGSGAGATVAAGYQVIVNSTSTGRVRLLSAKGELIAVVGAGQSNVLIAHGDATYGWWQWVPVETVASLIAAQETAVGAGAAIAFGATTPGAIATPATVNRFIKMIASDGLPVYIPGWR